MANPHPIVTVTMEAGGRFRAELYPEQAPNTVNNFIGLVRRGYYDGLIFHRAIPGFMIQGGCPEGMGSGGPGYTIAGEFLRDPADPSSYLPHERGVLSMARTQDPDSAGSQFFVMVADSAHLDRQYAAFGKVIEGMDVVDAIVAQPTGPGDRPETPQRMTSVTVETHGVDYPEPETRPE